MNKKILFALILVLTALVIFLLPNDRKKITRNLETLAEYCSTATGEPTIAFLKKGSLAGKLCTNPCLVELVSSSIHSDFSRKELTDHILMMKRTLPETHFSFHDTSITFAQKKSASIHTTLKILGKIDSDRFTNAYELSIHTKKIDGKWLFSAFHVIEFMER